MEVKVFHSKGVIFEGTALKVTVPAVEGEITILPHHISIITNLEKGRLIIFKEDGEKIQKKISGGICSFSDDCASILVGEIGEA